MTAKISTPIGEATIENRKWTSDNKELEEYLNFMLDPYGAGGEDPNPDLTAAMLMVELLPKAKLISYTSVKSEPGVIY